MTVGERLKRRRKELGMSAEAVAEKLGVFPSTVCGCPTLSIIRVHYSHGKSTRIFVQFIALHFVQVYNIENRVKNLF